MASCCPQGLSVSWTLLNTEDEIGHDENTDLHIKFAVTGPTNLLRLVFIVTCVTCSSLSPVSTQPNQSSLRLVLHCLLVLLSGTVGFSTFFCLYFYSVKSCRD